MPTGRYCIRRGEENNRKLLSIIEYILPQKLTTGKLIGFRKMDLKIEIIDGIDIPSPYLY